ncbi:protease HtpX [Alkalimonas mucilaginosa]|uniref:Protease HtpX n=1 Tax=Alkalimonas mucilaginosa TaxID=3057676 RepID=A0ABU7JE15_9GAMM|nr:protease HtpX [Alkalimonas sp. MEB004]MEE2023661.1 protease HtpX [Alkalimonas sp. MEB004]
MKRVFLFLLTNLAVLFVLGIALSIIFSVFNIDRSGIGGLLVFAAVFGFGGSFISLAMSKWMAKRSTGAVVIQQPRNATEKWLVDTVARQARKAGIGMPEVAIYDSPEMNAFATGMKRNDALVAVSTGLLRNMREDEVEAVLAHEVSHIANGDMVTLTLIQGVVNTFVIFLARFIAGIIRQNNQQMGTIAYFGIVIVLEMLFGVLASIVVMWFSRHREYRADAGAARLEGANKMVAALKRLQHNHESRLEGSMAAFGIAGGGKKSELFMSHPPLEKRIAALQNSREF